MKRSRRILILLSLLMAIATISAAITVRTETTNSSHPEYVTNKKWRVGYVETDPFGNFAGTLYGLVQGLSSNGLLENVENIPYELGQSDSKEMWNWLASRNTGPYIEFIADAHYSLVDGKDVSENLVTRLKSGNDIDLLLAMGTTAGQLVASSEHSVPTMVFSTSNAIQSGIIESEHDSGKDHIWAHIDSDRYKRQIEVFHDIFKFKKLGMMFENSETGRVYAAYDEIDGVMKERGVDIFTTFVKEPENNSAEEFERYYDDILVATNKLAKEVDAMYLSLGVWDLKDLSNLLQPFYDNGIPVFSQLGAEEVMYGTLLSVSRADFSGIGLFAADNIRQIIEGAKPRDLPQIYGDTPSIVLNLEVAKKIDYKPPFDILLVADTIYQNIQR